MNKVAIYQLEGGSSPSITNGFVFSNSFEAKAGLYGIFSLGAGIETNGFADESNAGNPLYQSIITSNCFLRNMFITLCKTGTLDTPTGFAQDFIIYKNGIAELTISLDGSVDIIFEQGNLNILFLVGDLISFSFDNTATAINSNITLHTYFLNV